MSTTFKKLIDKDITSTRTLLHEVVPITGGILFNTYSPATSLGDEVNVKKFSHGMFQSVYDYPYLSSSANHILDVSMGYAPSSTMSSSAHNQNAKKINLYNQMAQLLMGHNISGSIQTFDSDGNLNDGASTLKMKEVIFLPFSRLLVKDEIKKGSFSMDIAMCTGSTEGDPPGAVAGGIGAADVDVGIVRVSDSGASSTYYTNSPAGEYGRLFVKNVKGLILSGSTSGTTPGGQGGAELATSCGLIFYQAGVVVLTSSLFHHRGAESGSAASNYVGSNLPEAHGFLSASAWISRGGDKGSSDATNDPKNGMFCTGSTGGTMGVQHITGAFTGSTMDHIGDHIRNRIHNISFNNTTELNSTVFFCRANHNEFNYSSNPTYLTGSKIRVKNVRTDAPKSYITTVGLYGPKSELLAVAKLSEPLRKDPTNEVTLRVRLDY